MAGTNSKFPTQKFKDAIYFAMAMGKPDDPLKQVIFKWLPEKTYVRTDPAGRPYSFDATPTTTITHDDITVPLAVEFSARPAGSRDTPIGQFDTSRAILTMFEEDYELVKTADYCVIDGNTYDINFDAPQINLFDAGIVSVHCEARDESR